MFKVFLALILMTSQAFAVTQWTASGVPASTGESASNFPAELYSQWSILQTLLQNYRQGFYLTYNNATTLTVGTGEVSAWNGSAALYLQNTSVVNATTANLDTGVSFTASTTYYVYAGTSSTTAATATIAISLSNTSPSSLTYYKMLGSFTTDSSGNIGQITDNAVVSKVGAITTGLSTNVVYQAQTDLFLSVGGQCKGASSLAFSIISDSSPAPTQVLSSCSSGNAGTAVNFYENAYIRKGNYWEATTTYGAQTLTVIATPIGQ